MWTYFCMHNRHIYFLVSHSCTFDLCKIMWKGLLQPLLQLHLRLPGYTYVTFAMCWMPYINTFEGTLAVLAVLDTARHAHARALSLPRWRRWRGRRSVSLLPLGCFWTTPRVTRRTRIRVELEEGVHTTGKRLCATCFQRTSTYILLLSSGTISNFSSPLRDYEFMSLCESPPLR